MNHVGFWWEFAGKVGAPIFAATLVACLLSGETGWSHGLLMGVGLVLMGLGHWEQEHRKTGPPTR